MLLRRLALYFVLVVLTATLCISARPSREGYDDPVILPTEGAIEERPFFSTRRHSAIDYDRPARDVAGELMRKIEDGTAHLKFEKTSGYLRSVLEALHVPIESQGVLFSKTSLQSHFITPENPRAVYFADDVTIGFIRNAPLLEISAQDPQQGVVFYAIEQHEAERPNMVRSDSCLSCHETRSTMYVPGMLARSIGAGRGGETFPDFGNYLSDHRSPIEERWGGWFITGKTGTAHHMGNEMITDDGELDKASSLPKSLATLDGRFDPTGYLSHYSDVAAVMVLDHQVGMTNLLTRVGWESRVALDQQTKNPKDKAAADRLVTADARELADYLLFADEAPLKGKFESTSGFQTKFAASGKQDKRGRSLKQLDLNKRLMRYPCSYMIYSRAFDDLPAPAKDAVYARLWAVLSGKDKAPKYAKLSAADRAAVVGILLDTKPDLPKYFKPL